MLVRYVGKTNNPSKRLKDGHIPSSKGGSTHTAHWIAKLLSEGVRPFMVIVDSFQTDEQALEAERRWIPHYRASGADLTNATEGGEGMAGYTPTDETRKRLGDARRGKPQSKECIEKRAARLRGMKRTEEQRKRMSESAKARGSNNQGIKPRRKSSSAFVGVYWNAASGKWGARARVDGKDRFFGYHLTEEEAAVVYDAAAFLYYGAGARTNLISGG